MQDAAAASAAAAAAAAKKANGGDEEDNDELTSAQLSWAVGTMKDIARDLTKDDTGLEDLD